MQTVAAMFEQRPALHGPFAAKALRVGLAAAGVSLGVVAYRVQTDNLGAETTSGRALAIVAVAWAFLAAGLVAWARRPGNRLGALMTAAAFALLLRQLRYSHVAVLFTVFFALGELGYVLVAHIALAYPSGRLRTRAERVLLAIGYGAAILFPLAVLMVYDGSEGLRFFDASRRHSLLLVAGDAHATKMLQQTFAIAVYGVLATLFVVLITRRLALATHRERRLLAPLLLAAVAIALRAVFEGVFTFVNRPTLIVYDYLLWWQVVAFLALPLALLAGLLRTRLARAGVGDLLVELEDTPPERLRDSLARALHDPSLELLFWLPDQGGYADAAGRPRDLPSEGAGRAVTPLSHDGEPLGALAHDPSLLDEPKLIAAAGAAARLALEHARLQAETRAQLATVREARRRVATAGDDERRRIERDLHDGAQQRLLALALRLRTEQRRRGADADPDVDRLLEETVDELRVAVEELRDLARGVHPVVLDEEGLAAALEELVARCPLPVEIETDEARLPADVEAAAYFVACEALANVLKHAGASGAKIGAARRGGLLVVTVEDDGIGGAQAAEGSGLRGLAERLEALDGRLRVDSPPGGGTRVVGEIPCAS